MNALGDEGGGGEAAVDTRVESRVKRLDSQLAALHHKAEAIKSTVPSLNPALRVYRTHLPLRKAIQLQGKERWCGVAVRGLWSAAPGKGASG